MRDRRTVTRHLRIATELKRIAIRDAESMIRKTLMDKVLKKARKRG